MSDVRARETERSHGAYGGVLICRRRASRRHCRAKSIGPRLRNDSRNTGSDSEPWLIPVASSPAVSINFSTGRDRSWRKRCPLTRLRQEYECFHPGLFLTVISLWSRMFELSTELCTEIPIYTGATRGYSRNLIDVKPNKSSPFVSYESCYFFLYLVGETSKNYFIILQNYKVLKFRKYEIIKFIIL